ncbi:MAG: binding--dependent transport system inner rane component family protein [Microvirga sp.]|jgi:putative spermidine/putrescine transport system permease protein|nr:binding--dependent transport system inner rane component family protein [Microvirga sp.]
MTTLSERIGQFLLLVVVWAGLAFLTLPLAIIVAVSFTETDYLSFPPVGFTLKWYERFLADTSYLESIGLSASIAFASTAIAILIGVPAALVVARSVLPGRKLVSTIFLAPLILPTIVVGAALLQYASALGFARSYFALLVGHVVIIVPYILRTVLASLERFDKSLEEASQDLGANSFSTFFLVTLPIIKPGIVAGALFALIISWINVELSIFNSTASLMPIPVKLFNYVQYAVDPMVAAISAATIYVAIVAVVILDVFVGIDRVAVSQK